MSVLANYEPKSVFSYFEKLCTIPRGSGNTDGIASYLVSFAEEHGLENYRDAANNVIIRKLIDCIKVLSKTEILIIFKGGIEVKAIIEQ